MVAPSSTALPIGIREIEEAQRLLNGELSSVEGTIKRVAHHTPLVFSEVLSRQLHCQVWLKLENLQKTGSYKIRGAYNAMAHLEPEVRNRGVVTASAGNHAQGVGLAAALFGIEHRTTIFVPIGTPKVKQDNTRGYGVEVIETGENFDSARASAYAEAADSGRVFIEPFDDWQTIAGQGTVGLEILDDLPSVSGIIVPVGGGGLISGIAIAAMARAPHARVIGVEAEGAPSMIWSLQQKTAADLDYPPMTQIADGIRVRRPGDRPFIVCRELLGLPQFMTVPDLDTVGAIADLMVYAKVIAEGAGAISLAALRDIQEGNQLDQPPFTPDDDVVVVISGGNIDPSFSWRILYEQTVPNLLALRVAMPDRPGELLRMLVPISQAKVNIIDVDVNRLDARPRVGERIVEVCVAVSTQSQADALIESMGAVGYRVLVSRWQDPRVDRDGNLLPSRLVPPAPTSNQRAANPTIVVKSFRLTDALGHERPNNRFVVGEPVFVFTHLCNVSGTRVESGMETQFFAHRPDPVHPGDKDDPEFAVEHGHFPSNKTGFTYVSVPGGTRESRFRGTVRFFSQSEPGSYTARVFADSTDKTGVAPELRQATAAYEIVTELPSDTTRGAAQRNPQVTVVNKKHPLPVDYVPSDLRTPFVHGGAERPLKREASEAVERLFAAAAADGIDLTLLSGYRSYAYQQELRLKALATRPIEIMDRRLARPGYSEHQTGLAADIGQAGATTGMYDAEFADTAAGKWLSLHAREFGFILRYPLGKESETGYVFEPWHFRYVGVPFAVQVEASGLTLDEFMGVEAGDYVEQFTPTPADTATGA